MNITERQKKIILKFMRENENFARGKMRYNSGNKKILDDMWIKMSTTLNSTGSGPQKNVKEWQKTWRDWKSNVLKKYASNRRNASGTGESSSQVINLTELEEDLLLVIGPESAGLPDIPDGGNFNRFAKRQVSAPQLNESDSTDGSPKRPKFYTQIPLKSLDAVTPSCSTLNNFEFDFVKQEVHAASDVSNVDFMDRIQSLKDDEPAATVNDTLPSQSQNKVFLFTGPVEEQEKRRESSPSIDFMRRQIELKEEKLKVAKEMLQYKQEKLEFTQRSYSDFNNILKNINRNLFVLRQAVEKIVPEYLE